MHNLFFALGKKLTDSEQANQSRCHVHSSGQNIRAKGQTVGSLKWVNTEAGNKKPKTGHGNAFEQGLTGNTCNNRQAKDCQHKVIGSAEF